MVKTKTKYVVSTIILAIFLVALGLLSTINVKAAADTCTWTGAGSDSKISTAGNWTGCDNGNIPESGDNLIFPDGPSSKTVVIDTGISVNNIQFTGSNYTVNSIDGTVNFYINNDLTISGNNNVFNVIAYFFPTTTGTLTNSGTGTVFHDEIVLQPSAAGAEFTFDIDGDLTAPNIASAGSNDIDTVHKTGGGTMSISGEGTPVAGFESVNGLEISDGTWSCDVDNCLGTGNKPVLIKEGGDSDAAVLQLNATGMDVENDITINTATGDAGTVSATKNATVSGDITLTSSGKLHADGATLAVNGTVSVASGKTLTYDGFNIVDQVGAVSGAGNIIADAGRVTFRANNTYSGTTTIKNGTELELRSSGVLGTSTSGTTIEDGGQVTVTSVTGDQTYAEPLTISGAGVGGSEGAITDADADDDITFSGAIALNGDATIHNVFNDSTLSLSGVISGTGNLTIGGSTGNAAPYTLGDSGSSANTFNGDVIVNGSDLSLAKDGAVPGNLFITASSTNNASAGNSLTGGLDLISDDGVVTLTKNGAHTATLSYGGMANEETIGGLAGDGTVVMDDSIGTQTLNLNVTGNQTFSGSLTANIINKTGSGTQTLSGDVVADTINVNNGGLVVNGETTAALTVDSGSILKGNGEIGNATVAGTLAPGNSPGKITVNGNLDLTNGTYNAQLNGTTAGSQYDQTVITGTATLSNTTLDIDLGFTPSVGDTFTILRADTINGQFNNLSDGSTLSINGTEFRINYNLNPGGEDTVTLTVLSAPSTAGTPNTGLLGQDMAIYGLALLAGIGLSMSEIKPLRRFINAKIKRIV